MSSNSTTNRYDKYKDSGIEWIGEVPDSWGVRKIKSFSTICGRIGFKGYTIEDLVEPETQGAAIVLGGTNIMSEGYISFDKLTFLSEFKYLESPEIMLQGGEILITKVGAGTGDNAIYKRYSERVTINPNVMLCKPSSNINSVYLNYCLLSPLVKQEVFLESNKSGAQPAINQQFIKNLIVAYPSLGEQEAIAGYLDRKCGAIDETIEKQKSVIEKLKEYKQSIITQAVTKGLDKSAPMKDSGIEWIGQIPQHWKVKKGKRLLQLQNRPVIEGMEVVTCFRDGEVTLRKNRREDGFTFSDKEIGYQGIEIGDLVIHGMDGFAGAIGISDSYGKGSPVLNVCTAKNNDNLAYISFYLKVLASQNVFLAIATGIRERSCDLRWNKIANLDFVIPTKQEQKNIVEFLDKKCSEIDKTIEDKEKLIEKLVEYKKSLIYECVTGKRKVVA